LILQGPNGFSRKGAGESAASQYYSFTRLATVGTIEVDGQIHQVKGQSWMDKEFSTHSLGSGQVGWDWFSLQLDDGRELMLYVLRNAEGNVDTARGTLVESDAQVSYFGRDAFEISVNDSWTSPSGDSYPSEWRIRHADASLDLIVRPQMADQENRSKLIPTLRYWEGAVDVTSPEGKRVGVGFVEMTGYGSATTPAL
jgi:predicted secreted hydrolase